MQIYPNEVLKDLCHGSQLGITGLPVSFADSKSLLVLSELHLFSSLFKFLLLNVFGSCSGNIDLNQTTYG